MRNVQTGQNPPNGANGMGQPPAPRPPAEPDVSTSRSYYEGAEDLDEDEADGNDPKDYYASGPAKVMAEEVKSFMNTTFRKCIPKRKRTEMAKEYPRPDMPAAKVPKMDPDIKSALGRDQPDRRDESLSKVQASVLASCSPLANFWSHLQEQGFEGKEDELIPASDVLRVTKDTLALIGNASNYISQTRRSTFIDSISGTRPNLAKFLREICKDDLGDTGTELFGPQARKKITDRADTIDAFNKAVSKVESVPKSTTGQVRDSGESSRFLSKRPSAMYGSRSGRSYIPYNRGARSKARPAQFQPKNAQNRSFPRGPSSQPNPSTGRWK